MESGEARGAMASSTGQPLWGKTCTSQNIYPSWGCVLVQVAAVACTSPPPIDCEQREAREGAARPAAHGQRWLHRHHHQRVGEGQVGTGLRRWAGRLAARRARAWTCAGSECRAQRSRPVRRRSAGAGRAGGQALPPVGRLFRGVSQLPTVRLVDRPEPVGVEMRRDRRGRRGRPDNPDRKGHRLRYIRPLPRLTRAIQKSGSIAATAW